MLLQISAPLYSAVAVHLDSQSGSPLPAETALQRELRTPVPCRRIGKLAAICSEWNGKNFD